MSTQDDETTAHWEERYGREEQIWSGNPNGILVAEAADLTAGTALDVGCGEGADAIWLASKGWQVTAVDVSQTALDRAARAADEAGVSERIDWQRHDLARSFPSGAYDLVNVQYLHSTLEDFPRDDILRATAAAVAPGGTLLIVGHAATPPWAQEHHDHHEFPTPEETAGALGLNEKTWDLAVCEIRERDTIAPNGEPATITDSVVKATRRAS